MANLIKRKEIKHRKQRIKKKNKKINIRIRKIDCLYSIFPITSISMARTCMHYEKKVTLKKLKKRFSNVQNASSS